MFSKRHVGFTLIEMVMAIVIIGVGLAGVLAAFNTTVRSSADPLINKQMLAVAEEMMEEIQLKPFAVTGVAPANALQSCDGAAPPSRANFDDVTDYNNYSTTGICDIDGAGVAGLAIYNLTVTTNHSGLDVIAAADAIRISVTVTRGADAITLVGWRTNYAI